MNSEDIPILLDSWITNSFLYNFYSVYFKLKNLKSARLISNYLSEIFEFKSHEAGR